MALRADLWVILPVISTSPSTVHNGGLRLYYAPIQSLPSARMESSLYAASFHGIEAGYDTDRSLNIIVLISLFCFPAAQRSSWVHPLSGQRKSPTEDRGHCLRGIRRQHEHYLVLDSLCQPLPSLSLQQSFVYKSCTYSIYVTHKQSGNGTYDSRALACISLDHSSFNGNTSSSRTWLTKLSAIGKSHGVAVRLGLRCSIND